jgi:hypothetical protein
MKIGLVVAGMAAGIVLGAIVPVVAQYTVLQGALYALPPSANTIFVCANAAGAQIMTIKPSATEEGNFTRLACPP